MMDILKTTVKEIAGFLLIVSILENLIQDANFKKYLKMAAGIVLILIIIHPVVKLSGSRYDYSELFTLQEYEEDIQQMEQALGDINRTASADIMNQYKLYMEEKINRDLTEAGFDIREVTVALSVNREEQVELGKMTIRCNNGPQGKMIRVGAEAGGIDAEKQYLKKYTANLYGIDEALIEII